MHHKNKQKLLPMMIYKFLIIIIQYNASPSCLWCKELEVIYKHDGGHQLGIQISSCAWLVIWSTQKVGKGSCCISMH